MSLYRLFPRPIGNFWGRPAGGPEYMSGPKNPRDLRKRRACLQLCGSRDVQWAGVLQAWGSKSPSLPESPGKTSFSSTSHWQNRWDVSDGSLKCSCDPKITANFGPPTPPTTHPPSTPYFWCTLLSAFVGKWPKNPVT